MGRNLEYHDDDKIISRNSYLPVRRGEKQFLMPPPREDWQTDHEWVQDRTFEQAKCLGYWVGNVDFFFCHWEAEDEQDIQDALASKGLNEFVVTACYRAHDHVHVSSFTGNQRNYGPWRD